MFLSFAIIFIIGCVEWIIYHNSNEKKSFYQALIVNNDNGQNSIIVHDIKGNQDKVFKALKDKGYTGIGNNEVEFGKLMNKSANRRKVYDALVKEGYKGIGKDYDEFEKLIYQAQNDNIGKLYGLLKKEGYNDIGTEEQFRHYVSDVNNAKKLHGLLEKAGYDDIGTEDQFLNWLGVEQQLIPKTQPMAEKPLQTLHRTLLKYNWDVPEDYSSFERTLTAKGEQGYRNRYALWKALKSDNYDVPDDYESFSRTLFVPKRTRQSATQTQSLIYKSNRLNDLFDDLRAKGFAKDKTREEFYSYMLAPGKQGYQNRKDFFDDYKSNGLTDLNSYEEFAKWLGLRPAKQQ
jgi:mRNA-degrading endonuclease HigB of HigAB toxin-antitoxin module